MGRRRVSVYRDFSARHTSSSHKKYGLLQIIVPGFIVIQKTVINTS
jgi:hypothetical protein